MTKILRSYLNEFLLFFNLYISGELWTERGQF